MSESESLFQVATAKKKRLPQIPLTDFLPYIVVGSAVEVQTVEQLASRLGREVQWCRNRIASVMKTLEEKGFELVDVRTNGQSEHNVYEFNGQRMTIKSFPGERGKREISANDIFSLLANRGLVSAE